MDVGTLLGYFNPLFTHNWTINRPQQMALMRDYRDRLAEGKPLTSFDEAGFRAFSQTDEDGLLLLLFAVIGFESKRAVELCCGDGIECIAANWVVNHGFEALMVDGNGDHLAMGRSFYDKCRDTGPWPPTMVEAWVTAETVNDLVTSNGFDGDIDLLSIDLDGNDYWIWKALDAVRPRVVVIEYQPILGPDDRLTVPYDPAFKATWQDHRVVHGGASLAALTALAEVKGYRLVATNRLGFNAIFLRADLATESFPTIAPHEGFNHTRAHELMRSYGASARRHPWIKV